MTFDDVFISYGRKESKAFARRLHDRLRVDGYEVWFDQEDIPLGVDFQDQIDDGITHAHNFVFIIAPHAIDSPYCLKEIELAVAHKKRIIPLLHVPAHDAQQEERMHPAVRRINWLPFTNIERFEDNYADFIRVMQTHQAYVQLHTALLVKSIKWEKSLQEPALLLEGERRKEAERWLHTDFGKDLPPCLPTDLQCEFIAESKKHAFNQHTDVFLANDTADDQMAAQIRLQLLRQGTSSWWAGYDLRAGIKEWPQVEAGIELADNFVFLLSPEGAANPDLLRQLAYALRLNKRVVPLVLRPIEREQVPELLRGENLVQWASNNRQDFFAELAKEKDFLRQHTTLLALALAWERQNYNNSILLRGFGLQNAENWLRIAERHPRGKPTELQLRFITESSQKSGSLSSEVFLSYSRADGDFARRLNAELQLHGKSTWFDQENIPETASYRDELAQGIRQSDNLLFVLSERAVISPHRDGEIELAQRLGKRILTVLVEDFDKKLLPAALASYQPIDFRAGVQEFHTSFSQLLRSLDTDRDYVSAHNRWTQAADKWSDAGKLEELLLRGVECDMASQWLRQAVEQHKTPSPTPLQVAFIEASDDAVAAYNRRKLVAAFRLRIMTIVMGILAVLSFLLAGWSLSLRHLAEQERANALEKKTEAEAASHEALRQRKLAENKRREAELAQAEAMRNYQRAEKERLRAERNEKIAIAKTREAQENLTTANINEQIARENALLASKEREKAVRSAELAHQRVLETRALAFLAKAREVESQNPTLAMHLALEAQRIRPNDPQIQNALRSIYYANNFYHPFAQLETAVSLVKYAPDGNLIAVLTQTNEVQIWNTFGERVRSLKGHQGVVSALAFSADSRYLATGATDKTVRLWDLTTGTSQVVGQHAASVTAVAIAPGAVRMVASAATDKSLRLWSFEGTPIPFVVQPDAPVLALRFSPDGKQLLAGSADKTASLWRLTGRRKRLVGHHGAVTCVAFSPDGRLMATGSDDRDIILWNPDGEVQAVLSGHNLSVRDVEFSYDSQLLISASRDKTARLWSVNGEELQLFKGHQAEVSSVAFSPDEDFVLSASADQTVRIWLVNSGSQQILRTIAPAIVAFAYSPLGYMAVTTGTDEVQLLDDNAATLRTLDKHKYPVRQIAFAPRGNFVATADERGQVLVWGLDGKELNNLRTGLDISLLRVDPQGKHLLIGTRSGELGLWSLDGYQKVKLPLHELSCTEAVFSADGSKLLTIDGNGAVRIWTSTGQLVLDLGVGQGAATAALFAPSGTDFYLAFESGQVHLFDALGAVRQRYVGHSYPVRALALAADGRSLLSGADDRSARLWDASGEQLEIYTGHRDVLRFVGFASDKKSILTVGRDHSIRRWSKSISYEEYARDYGFGQLSVRDRLTHGLLEYDSLRQSESVPELVEGANYYLGLATVPDADKSTAYKQSSVVLLARAAQIEPDNTALRQRLALGYFDLAWAYLLRKEFERAASTARLADQSLPNTDQLVVRHATALLYNDQWNEAKEYYAHWKVKNPRLKKDFIAEIERLEDAGLYARYRRQARELLEN